MSRFALTIRHLLDSARVSAADQSIVYRDQVRMSYRDLDRRIGGLAAALDALGVGAGTIVGVLDWDSHRYLEAYFAVPGMGAILQTVNVRLAPEQIAYTLRHAAAEVLLVHRDFIDLVGALRAELPALRAVICLADGVEAPLPDWAVGEYEALLAVARTFDFPEPDENAIATTFYTTGTTGLPKAVRFSHRQIVLQTLAMGSAICALPAGFGYHSVYMPLTPMFHVHAWGFPYLATMLGVRQVYPGRYEPGMILDLRRREGISFSHGVPTLARMLIDAAALRGDRLDGWTMIVGGSALTRDLWTEADAAGLRLIAGYGMSETGPVVSIARPPAAGAGVDPAAAMMASGMPVPLVSTEIVGADMRPVAHDGRSQGELVIRSPWLVDGYAGDESASAALWQGGWLHTQDVATIDADGTIQVRDRIKDVIKSGGEWICSLTLEELVAAAVPAIAEIAIVGVPDPRWGERPVAAVVARAGADVGLDELNVPLRKAAATGAIGGFALIDRMILLEALPKTSVGKIDKKLLRDRFGHEQARARESEEKAPAE